MRKETDGRSFIEKRCIPVPESGCWIWANFWTPKTYGRAWRNGVLVFAHRFAYESFKGPIPEDKFVCHKCDTPSCCNPDHLYLGTHKENMADMKNRNRQATGASHGCAKLSEEQVKAIRADKRKRKDICAEYGISVGTVSSIRVGRSWRMAA